jgi:hypothetical protein
MNVPERKARPSSIWERLVLPEEDKRHLPGVPPWDGGYRWFKSSNVIDLQHYRSPAEKERIRANLLGRP